jgi:hypothetical protein
VRLVLRPLFDGRPLSQTMNVRFGIVRGSDTWPACAPGPHKPTRRAISELSANGRTCNRLHCQQVWSASPVPGPSCPYQETHSRQRSAHEDCGGKVWPVMLPSVLSSHVPTTTGRSTGKVHTFMSILSFLSFPSLDAHLPPELPECGFGPQLGYPTAYLSSNLISTPDLAGQTPQSVGKMCRKASLFAF